MATIGEDPIWLITGCSSGFGRALARAVLGAGGRAVVSARNPATLDELVGDHPGRGLAVKLDVSNTNDVAAAVRQAEETFGQIDVLVNNAGYGYLAAIEEGTEADYRALFETNVFGLIAMCRAVLPGMRARRRGHVVNISSIAGFVGQPSACFYSGTKFAVEGISEALAADLKPLGISVTIVEPGPFRTDFAGRSLRTPGATIVDYAETVGLRRNQLIQRSGKQPGDPARAAAAIIEAVNASEPPLRLLLGAAAFDMARTKLTSLGENFNAWAETARTADFPSA